MEADTQRSESAPIACHVCGATFGTEQELAEHLMDAHADPGEDI